MIQIGEIVSLSGILYSIIYGIWFKTLYPVGALIFFLTWFLIYQYEKTNKEKWKKWE